MGVIFSLYTAVIVFFCIYVDYTDKIMPLETAIILLSSQIGLIGSFILTSFVYHLNTLNRLCSILELQHEAQKRINTFIKK